MTRTDIVLYKGAHSDTECADGQRCLFEWYNWLARQVNTDTRPPGVSPVLHQFGMALNDRLPDSKRQELAVLLPNGTSPLAGTETDGRDETRGYMALDWLLRTFAPAWLDLAGLAGEASALRDFRRVADLAAAQAIRPHVDTASAKASAAWDAAWDAAGAAAGAALAPTIDILQDSAIALYHEMIRGEWQATDGV